MLIHIVALLALYYALCALYHKYVRCTGQVERVYKTVLSAPLLGDAAVSAAGSATAGSSGGAGALASSSSASLGASGVAGVVGYYSIAGDLGTALVAEEVFVDRVYFRNGVTLRDAGAGRSGVDGRPLVLDIGAHIGLFALSVLLRERGDAIVVGAEPIPQLHALAERNTSVEGVGAECDVFIECMALGGPYTTGLDLTVDPFITAGTSAYLPDITRPLLEHRYANFFAFIRAVGLDNVRAGNFPYVPTAALCHTMKVPVLRVVVLLLISPFLLLVGLFYLAGPHERVRVRSHQGTLRELLERAATRAGVKGEKDPHTSLARRICDPATPIDLIKIDVEGAEMDVLEGISDAEWDRIRQLVVEVHDLNGRVAAVRKLLATKGFNHVVVDDEDWASHELLRIRSVYAKKIG